MDFHDRTTIFHQTYLAPQPHHVMSHPNCLEQNAGGAAIEAGHLGAREMGARPWQFLIYFVVNEPISVMDLLKYEICEN